MEEVVSGVWIVGGPGITADEDCCVYAVDGGSEVALVDCGAGRTVGRLLANLAEAGLGDKPLATLVLTHGHVDHIGGAAELARLTGARLVCHEGDREAIESGDPRRTASSWYGISLPRLTVDHTVKAKGEILEIGGLALCCLHTPGHTPGSLSLLLETDKGRVLFGQDVHGPFLADFGSDEDQWAESMGRLLALRPDVLCEGHYGVIRPRKAVEEFIRGQLAHQGYE